MLSNLVHGLTALGNGPALAYLIGGSILGMVLGVLPGVGGIVLLSIVLSLINHINLIGTLCLFLAVQAASYFSASITSILLNTPSHPEAFAVTFDGYPMAQRGEAGRALGISATSTCIGGLIGCVVLIGFIQAITVLPLLFHPPEYVALITIAMLLVATLGTDSTSKALISAALGLMLSTIGASPVTGTFRYTFNAVGLYGGVSLVALALGVFAIPQMVLVFGTATTVARQDMTGKNVSNTDAISLQSGFGKQVIGGIFETLSHWLALLRAAVIGVVCGVIPGIGGFAANFLSYGVAEQMSRKNRDKFGTGIAEGIIAPEGSSLAKEAGGMVPVIGLGIPGGVGNALLLAALTIKGIQVGFGFTKNYPVLPYTMTWIIALGGVIGTVAGVLAAPWLARITKVRGPVLVPFVFSLCVIGPFVATTAFFSVMEVLVFGVVGFALRRLRYSLASFVIGLVLGPTLEDNIYLTHNVYAGVSFLQRPLTDVLFAIGVLAMVVKTRQMRQGARKARREAQLDPSLSPAEIEAVVRQREREQNPYPLLGMITTTAMFVISVLYTWYGGTHYNLQTALMPVIVGSVASLATLWRLPIDIRAYVRYRRDKREASVPTSLAVEVPEPVPAGVLAGPPSGVEFPFEDQDDLAPAPVVGELGSNEEIAGSGGFPPITDKSWGRNGSYLREFIAFCWFAFLVALCWAFGFTIGVSAFCLLYGLSAMRRMFPAWHTRVVFALVCAATMGFMSYEMLNLLHLTFKPAFSL